MKKLSLTLIALCAYYSHSAASQDNVPYMTEFETEYDHIMFELDEARNQLKEASISLQEALEFFEHNRKDADAQEAVIREIQIYKDSRAEVEELEKFISTKPGFPSEAHEIDGLAILRKALYNAADEFNSLKPHNNIAQLVQAWNTVQTEELIDGKQLQNDLQAVFDSTHAYLTQVIAIVKEYKTKNG